jgi:glycosyltransferase involved in cell wall biosynthesis
LVVVSSGFHKTHVTTAAGESSRRGLLSLAITGAYPTEPVKRLIRALRLAGTGRIARLMERGEPIPEQELRPLFLPELLDELARVFARIPLIGRLYRSVSAATWRLYGRLAAGRLAGAAGARIYHYRAGFGGRSIARARELGLVTVCDHSTVHPALLETLIANRGKMPRADGDRSQPSGDPIVRRILEDIDAADRVLVNSEFVKRTFLEVGWPDERVHVLYLGVDDNFIEGDVEPPAEPTEERLQLLFAGRFQRDKGAEVLIDALSGLGPGIDWELLIAGPIPPEIRAVHGGFLEDERVKQLGTLLRPELRRRMLAAPVFVFPSFAEGSARAVFEALACGCYVITTPNSGTIVEQGVHGALVPPGDAERLAEAIAEADRDRTGVAQIGRRNAELVAAHFRQSNYGDGLESFYVGLTGQAAGRE